jgi:PhnB protein
MHMISTIQPWLYVKDSVKALQFYKEAFGAKEEYKLEVPGGVIAKLSVGPAIFWISEEEAPDSLGPASRAGHTSRFILVAADPEPLFARALKAGANEMFPVGEDHGWKLGRLVDPFGHHWEIGHEVSSS